MSKVKDFVTEEQTVEENPQTTYQEAHEYYDIKEKSWYTNVDQNNNSMLELIKVLSGNEFHDEILKTERDKALLKAIKNLKYTDEGN
jgi:hypothetical protein